MIVTDGDLRPVSSAQTEFNPSVPSINVHLRVRWLEEHIVVRKETAIPIVPTSKLCVTSLDVAEIRFRQLHCYVIIVEIPQRVTIERKEDVFAHGSLHM
jgi:hypothetical protein